MVFPKQQTKFVLRGGVRAWVSAVSGVWRARTLAVSVLPRPSTLVTATPALCTDVSRDIALTMTIRWVMNYAESR